MDEPGAVPVLAPRLRRRPLLVVVAVALIAAGGVLGTWLWVSSTAASDVVLVRADIGRGEVIEAGDLGTARVGHDPLVRTVPATELTELVGQRAAVDLSAGALLAVGQVSSQVLPGSGETIVGIPLAPGAMPLEPLLAGDQVRLIHTPGTSGQVVGAPAVFEASVVRVGQVDLTVVVDVLVPERVAAEVAARAATGQVALVLDARER